MKARFYFDIISAFAYFYGTFRHRLEPHLQVEPVPVLLGSLSGCYPHQHLHDPIQ
jgi:hypothetical protein